MRNTRLFIYKQPIIHNETFNYIALGGGGYYDEFWKIPASTSFGTYGLVPYADDMAGTYAVHQDFGLDDVAVVKIGVVVDGIDNNHSGVIEIACGNIHQAISAPGTYIFDFEVTVPDATFGFDIVIHGSGGAYLPGSPVTNMGVKSIYLISAETQQYKEVDLFDNIDIPVTYNVADVQDISKKDSNFSLTVELPNTPNNALLFDEIKDIALYGSSFEMLKQYPAFVEVGGNRTFEGYLKLNKVIINDDNEITYEVNLYSNFIEFVKRLGTTTLRGNTNPLDDLSFSEYATQLTVVTDPTDPDYPGEWFSRTDMYYWDRSTTPWTPTGEKPYGKDFYFAPVDKFNFGGTRNSVTDGTGNKLVPMFLDELTPFLFVREIWDKIFEQAGFSYVSDFISGGAGNTTTFKFDHLVYPAVNPIVGTIHNYYSIVKERTSGLNSTNQFQWHKQSSGGTILNPTFLDGQDVYWNISNTQLTLEENPVGYTQLGLNPSLYWKYTAPIAGIYSINVNIPFAYDILLTDTQGNNHVSWLYGAVDANTNASWGFYFYLIHHITATNTDVIVGQYSIYDYYQSTYNVVGGRISNFVTGTLQIDQPQWGMEQGDYLYLRCNVILTEYINNTTTVINQVNDPYCQWGEINFPSGDIGSETIGIRLTSDLVKNGWFDPTIIINPKVKKVDFVNDIVKKFNLYIEDVTNKKDANGVYFRDYPGVRIGEPILKIEPRDLYYSTNQVVRDWTSKVDISTMDFKRIDDYLFKRLYFNDKDDSTYHVEDYNDYNYVEGEYGEKIITSPMNTSEDEKTEITTQIGQTMCGRVQTLDVPMSVNTYTQCPYIFTLDNSGTIKQDKDYNDRVLFIYNLYWADFADIYNKSRLKGWLLYERDNSNPGQFTTPFNITVRSYCLLDTFNQPFGSETADINYGNANWYYQNLNGTWATDKNCYNVFYADMVDEYNNPNSRLLTCNIYLSPSDIRDLQLSDTIIINNMAYHINKIDQWLNGEEACKVELIKIINSNSQTPVNILRQNRPPKINILTPAMIKGEVEEVAKDVAAVEKVVEENKDELVSNTKAIEQIQTTLKNIDERLKKLEG